MPRSVAQRRADALAIWRAGVAAVDSARLVRQAVEVAGSRLNIVDQSLDLRAVGRIVVVGAGKAGAGMAAGLEQALGPRVAQEKHLAGWVHVPDDCVRPLERITLYGARPAGLNEPTEAGVRGTEEMLARVVACGPDDVCLCLLSGGASALLPAPHEGLALADKLAVTRALAGAGANITELNTVRKQLSRVKGGGLARACRAGRLITLVISDVLGDPLDVIGSGPTYPDPSTPADALAVLRRYAAAGVEIPPAVIALLERRAAEPPPPPPRPAAHHVIGNLAVAVDAAGAEAVARGYSPVMIAERKLEGLADEVGRRLAVEGIHLNTHPGPDALISGGEPVVKLVDPTRRGRGGRNQQLALAALAALDEARARGVTLLSGGTDGEDGPTDAAGAIVDEEIIAAARARGLDAADSLARNDAYTFFDAVGGLLRTGPTHTNVCDLRVVLVERDG